MKLHPTLGVASILFTALVACSSGSDPANTPNGGTSTDKNGTEPSKTGTSGTSGSSATLPSSISEAECTFALRCDPVGFDEMFDDVASCAANGQAYDDAANAAPGSGRTPEALKKCITAMVNASCTAGIGDLPECDFKGTLADSAACSFNEQCTSGNCHIDPDSTSGCGACGPKAVAGAPCSGDLCADGLTCDYGTNSCVALPATGATGCSTTSACANATDRCISNTCTAVLAQDAACTAPASGDQDPCPSSQRCLNGTCTDVTATAKPGEACGDSARCHDGHCENGACVANGKAGDASDPSKFECANAMYCDGDKKTCTSESFIPSCSGN